MPAFHCHKQSGNVLFLILIAVALFAALSYAVTLSGRGGGSIDRETARLRAAQLLAYGASLKMAADRMILSGTPADSIVMSTAACGAGVTCTSGANCLFAPDGGGATAPDFTFVDHYCFNTQTMGDVWFGVEGLGQDFSGTPPNATGYDMNIEIVRPGRAVCDALNQMMGITSMPQETDNSDHLLDDGQIPGKTDFCMQYDGGDSEAVSYIKVLNEQ